MQSECQNPSLLNLRWADTFAEEKHLAFNAKNKKKIYNLIHIVLFDFKS